MLDARVLGRVEQNVLPKQDDYAFRNLLVSTIFLLGVILLRKKI